MADKEEKWQQALEKWRIWTDSQQEARAEIETRYADKLPLIKDAKVKVTRKRDASGGLRIRINHEQWVKWEIETAIEGMADHFVTHEMGLPRHSDAYRIFFNYWVVASFPDFARQVRLRPADEELVKGPTVIIESRRDKKTGNRFVRSVSWYADEVDHHRIAEFLCRMDQWPIGESRERRHAGGRPREEERTVPEAIVCHILRKKMSEGRIGRAFGWKTRWKVCNRSGEGKFTCRLVWKRLKLAKDIFKNHGDVPTKQHHN